MIEIEEIVRTLRQARLAKGLSQRALSAKTGLSQSHISKIENAMVDVQLSNLLELARFLDLEFMLLPRKAVPIAQGLTRALEDKAFKGQATAMYRLDEAGPDD